MDADIELACQRLRAGELVAFPTETVYGLGADAMQPEAVAKIYALKGRPSNHPVIVHIAESAQMGQWASNIPEKAWALAERYWPGPLTMILPRAPRVPLAVTGGQDTIGIRVPSHPVARRLLSGFGGGVAAPSANRYGRISPTRAEHVHEEFGMAAPLVLDGGDCDVGLESTIVSLAGRPMLLRPGAISRAQIEAVVGPLHEAVGSEAPRAPGTTVSHYAPRTPLRWWMSETVGQVPNPDAAVLALRSRPAGHRGPWIQLPADPIPYGRALYAALRDLDHSGAPEILVETPPTDPAWEAVRDRLQRSAAAYSETELT
jgi:L-threonylcarbamoyladenylate synthase